MRPKLPRAFFESMDDAAMWAVVETKTGRVDPNTYTPNEADTAVQPNEGYEWRKFLVVEDGYEQQRVWLRFCPDDSYLDPTPWQKQLLVAIWIEYCKAVKKHPDFPTAHHGASVLREEFEEFWDEVKADNFLNARNEVAQLAATAFRFLHDINNQGKPQQSNG